VLKSYTEIIIKPFYVSHIMFIVYEATCFGPYSAAIIRPSYESSL